MSEEVYKRIIIDMVKSIKDESYLKRIFVLIKVKFDKERKEGGKDERDSDTSKCKI